MISVLRRFKATKNDCDEVGRTPLHYTTSERAIKLLLTYSSQNQCLISNENAYEMREYKKAHISVFRTTCLNFTLQTAFRSVGRDCVNVADSDGNTPLHSVVKRCLLKRERGDCIKIFLENGTNPNLFNHMGVSALESRHFDNCCDTDRYIVNYKQSLYKTHIVFAVATSLFLAFAVGLLKSFP